MRVPLGIIQAHFPGNTPRRAFDQDFRIMAIEQRQRPAARVVRSHAGRGVAGQRLNSDGHTWFTFTPI